MELLDALRSRRSVKNFDPDHRLTEEELHHLMSHGLLAPTSFNMQNWHFIAVTDRAVQQRLCAAAWHQAQLRDASVTLVLAGRLPCWNQAVRTLRHAPAEVQENLGGLAQGFYQDNPALQRDEAARSVGLAAMALMLVAKDMGYDSCPMIGFDAGQVAEIVGLPADHPPLLALAIGRALQPARPRMGFLDLEEVVSVNHFGNSLLSGEMNHD